MTGVPTHCPSDASADFSVPSAPSWLNPVPVAIRFLPLITQMAQIRVINPGPSAQSVAKKSGSAD
jgi:hypothetical protein